MKLLLLATLFLVGCSAPTVAPTPIPNQVTPTIKYQRIFEQGWFDVTCFTSDKGMAECYPTYILYQYEIKGSQDGIAPR